VGVGNTPAQHGIASAGFHHVEDLFARVLAMQQFRVKRQPGMPEQIFVAGTFISPIMNYRAVLQRGLKS